MNKLRVGFDARWYNDSGVGAYVAELLRAMVLESRGASGANGLELTVYEDPKNPVPGLPDKVKRVPLMAGKYSPASQLELRHRCGQDRLDLFHSPFYPIPLLAPCPVVVTIHDLIPFLFRTSNPLKQFTVKCGYRIAAHYSSRIIAVSNHTSDDITRILGTSAEKIAAIYNGVGQAFQAVPIHGEAEYLAAKYGIRLPYVLAASTRNWKTKNLASALKALSLARQRFSQEFQTVVYGPPEGLLAAGGAKAWTPLNLIQTGQLSAEELAKLFRNALLFIMPTLYEGFGLAVAEAMACGCAVISSNTSSLPEVAGDGAQLFGPADLAGMAEAVTRLLRNPDERRQWQEKALRKAAQFSWSKAARETAAVYYQAVSERKKRTNKGPNLR